jgi:tyramine---L-glutamate ligase
MPQRYERPPLNCNAVQEVQQTLDRPMRILVHEHVSGGGLAGRDVTPSLVHEGSAMRAALVSDLAALGRHAIVTTVDRRFPLAAPPGVEVVTLIPGRKALLDTLMSSVDAVWLIAPETGGCLERLAARAEQGGTTLLGSGAAAIRRASDKAGLPALLARCDVRHPGTRVFRRWRECEPAARAVGYPLVVKPARGAGCSGVCLADNTRELRRAVDFVRRSNGTGSLLLQRYVPGVAASVSLLADGTKAVALAVNGQVVRISRSDGGGRRAGAPGLLSYRGGKTPLDHPLAERAVEAALNTCRALPGLRGFVGVDLVLTQSEAFVIEVNPRLTTAYLGVRMALGENVAALVLAACAGALPARPAVRQSVRFTAAGRVACDRSGADRHDSRDTGPATASVGEAGRANGIVPSGP